MKREIIANVLPEESRVAVLENGRLAEFMIERPALGMAKLVGNIYKGKIENVLPGISSAFVNWARLRAAPRAKRMAFGCVASVANASPVTTARPRPWRWAAKRAAGRPLRRTRSSR